MTRIKKIGIRGIRMSFVDSDYNYFVDSDTCPVVNKKCSTTGVIRRFGL